MMSSLPDNEVDQIDEDLHVQEQAQEIEEDTKVVSLKIRRRGAAWGRGLPKHRMNLQVFAYLLEYDNF